jgi:hypothetical protein
MNQMLPCLIAKNRALLAVHNGSLTQALPQPGAPMTPDQLISTMHRQRADQMATRLALEDLANLLEPTLKARWMQALQSRIATARAPAPNLTQDQQAGLAAMATALDYLHRSMSRPAEPTAPPKSTDV